MTQQMPKTVLVPIGEGFEEIEAMSIVDVLRRAGCQVTFASIMGKDKPLSVLGAHGVTMLTDSHLEDCISKEYDLIALPGGMPGAQHLGDCKMLVDKLHKQKEENKYYAAICASPALVFEKHGLFAGEVGTAYPHANFSGILKNQSKINERVVISNKCITSQGPGTALEFAITLVEKVVCPEKALQLAKAMILKK